MRASGVLWCGCVRCSLLRAQDAARADEPRRKLGSADELGSECVALCRVRGGLNSGSPQVSRVRNHKLISSTSLDLPRRASASKGRMPARFWSNSITRGSNRHCNVDRYQRCYCAPSRATHHRRQDNFVVCPEAVLLRRLAWASHHKVIQVQRHVALREIISARSFSHGRCVVLGHLPQQACTAAP